MELLQFFAQFIYFILPGIIGIYFFRWTTNIRNVTEMRIIIDAFVLSTVAYLAGNGILEFLNDSFSYNFRISNITDMLNQQTIEMHSFTASIFTSLFFTIILILIVEKNVFFVILRNLKISEKADNRDAWDRFLKENEWIILRDYVTKNTYFGYLFRYSDRDDIREIVLSDVSVLREDGIELYEMKEVYLARHFNEFSLEVGNYDKGETKNGK